MYIKKIIPILALIAIMGVFMGAMHPISAVSTTEVKAYTFDAYDPPGTELGAVKNIKKGEDVSLAATLHVDGGNPKWFRWLHLYIYNSNGEQIYNEERNSGSGFSGAAIFFVDSRKWDVGDYKMCFTYQGNKNDGYPRADKEVKLQIT